MKLYRFKRRIFRDNTWNCMSFSIQNEIIQSENLYCLTSIVNIPVQGNFDFLASLLKFTE